MYTPTFSIVVSDIDGDEVDDLFVGRHGYPPTLYLNKHLKFVEQPTPFPSRPERTGMAILLLTSTTTETRILSLLAAAVMALAQGWPMKSTRTCSLKRTDCNLSMLLTIQTSETHSAERATFSPLRIRKGIKLTSTRRDFISLA